MGNIRRQLDAAHFAMMCFGGWRAQEQYQLGARGDLNGDWRATVR